MGEKYWSALARLNATIWLECQLRIVAEGADSHRRSQWRMGTDTMFILGNAISSNDF